MAQIIDIRTFDGTRVRKRESSKAALSDGAQILFFMGVRYERPLDVEPATDPEDDTSGAKRGRKRRA